MDHEPPSIDIAHLMSENRMRWLFDKSSVSHLEPPINEVTQWHQLRQVHWWEGSFVIRIISSFILFTVIKILRTSDSRHQMSSLKLPTQDLVHFPCADNLHTLPPCTWHWHTLSEMIWSWILSLYTAVGANNPITNHCQYSVECFLLLTLYSTLF